MAKAHQRWKRVQKYGKRGKSRRANAQIKAQSCRVRGRAIPVPNGAPQATLQANQLTGPDGSRRGFHGHGVRPQGESPGLLGREFACWAFLHQTPHDKSLPEARLHHAIHRHKHQLAQAEVFEWLGDAYLSELIANQLIRQHFAALNGSSRAHGLVPPPTRRGLHWRLYLRLIVGMVTNENLEQVFDQMGFAARLPAENDLYATQASITRQDHCKRKADFVESLVGEWMFHVQAQARTTTCTVSRLAAVQSVNKRFLSSVDAVLSQLVAIHVETLGKRCERQFRVAWNAFSCLPIEELDQATGQTTVEEVNWDAVMGRENLQHDKAARVLLEEDDQDDSTSSPSQPPRFHAFDPDPPVPTTTVCSHGHETNFLDGIHLLKQSIHRQMKELLRKESSSHWFTCHRDHFEMFRVYGMSLLAQRVSLAMCGPNLTQMRSGHHENAPQRMIFQPGQLTVWRQAVLKTDHLAQSAVALGICGSFHMDGTGEDPNVHDDLTRRRANSLRAFVGFHHHDQFLVNAISAFLVSTASGPSNQSSVPTYQDLMSTLSELHGTNSSRKLLSLQRQVQNFIYSPLCEDFHASARLEAPSATSLPTNWQQTSAIADWLQLEATDPLRLARAHNSSKPKQARDAHREKRGCPSRLKRFLHRRFLFCLEDLLLAFARQQTTQCREKLVRFEQDLSPCVRDDEWRAWRVDAHVLTLALRDNFFRLLVHDLCAFHLLTSTSKTLTNGTRVTQIRVPTTFCTASIAKLTNKQQAIH